MMILVSALGNVASAQDGAQRAVSNTAPIVTGGVSGDRIRFVAPSTVVRITVAVYSPDGNQLFEATGKGSVIDWNMIDGSGQKVSDGSLLCVVTVKSLSGKLSQRVGGVTVASGKAELFSKVALTDAQIAAIGPLEVDTAITAVRETDTPTATVVSHDGIDGQVTATAGDLTFKTGDVFSGTEQERMRITKDGKVGVGVKNPQAAFDVAGNVKADKGFTFSDGTTLNVDEKGVLSRKTAEGAPVPEVVSTDGITFTSPGGVYNRDINLTDNNGGIRIYGAPALTTVPNGAAIQFFGNGVGAFPGQAYIDSGANNSAAVIFRTAGTGQTVTERFRINSIGDIGINNSTPAFKLDILHTGSTGIRNKSSASFSTIDIDAFSGDAALRFAANGVNQWNLRNRPGDNYLEIFELGGGGSRFVIQDGTGNVGIGETTAPAYRLDVLHGGSTGTRIRSSASFSVVDIDANSGDAALRFVKAGVNQWNIRNRPADDYLEIFELGGGGSRFVIQDATGNVGIGETTNPTYRLDVLHGGATGARIRSSATFSVLDIDANSGDAALRFASNGVNKWNTRNNPANDNYQIFQLGGGGSRMQIDSATGAITQPITTSGLVKAGAVVQGGVTPSIQRQFNNLPAQATITITRLNVGTYEVLFGDDITGRFYLATPGGPTFGSTTGQISIAQRAGNVNGLFVVATDSSGATSDAVNFTLLIY